MHYNPNNVNDKTQKTNQPLFLSKCKYKYNIFAVLNTNTDLYENPNVLI